jgi:hypothetical protein
MREGGQGLARRLGVAIVLPDTPSRRHRPGKARRWAAAGAVLTTLAVAGWRWRTSSR